MTDTDKPVTVTEDDRQQAEELAVRWFSGPKPDESVRELSDFLAFALTETRERALVPLRRSHDIVQDQRNQLVARIADLEKDQKLLRQEMRALGERLKSAGRAEHEQPHQPTDATDRRDQFREPGP